MYKYSWNYNKTAEFMKMKKGSVTLYNQFIKQLLFFEKHLRLKGRMLSSGWFENEKEDVCDGERDELTMNNTFVNLNISLNPQVKFYLVNFLSLNLPIFLRISMKGINQRAGKVKVEPGI